MWSSVGGIASSRTEPTATVLEATTLLGVRLTTLETVGLSAGGVALFATLAGGGSYMAAPTAIRLALPEANAALAITTSLAIPFHSP